MLSNFYHPARRSSNSNVRSKVPHWFLIAAAAVVAALLVYITALDLAGQRGEALEGAFPIPKPSSIELVDKILAGLYLYVIVDGALKAIFPVYDPGARIYGLLTGWLNGNLDQPLREYGSRRDYTRRRGNTATISSWQRGASVFRFGS